MQPRSRRPLAERVQDPSKPSQSSRSPQGNRFMRRILTQAAEAAVKMNDCFFQFLFRMMLPPLGYKAAI